MANSREVIVLSVGMKMHCLERQSMTTRIANALTNIVNQPLSTSTVHRQLRKTGMKAVVKSKQPLLSAKHCKACLDFAYAHKYWILEDWKKVAWSGETKINHLGSDGCKWVWKKARKGLSERLVEDTVKFGGGS